MLRRFSRKFRKLAVDLLDLPQDIVFDMPRLTMVGDRQLTIENHRGVLHFSEDRVLLELGIGKLEITGSEMVIRSVWTEEIFIEGVIKEIRLQS